MHCLPDHPIVTWLDTRDRTLPWLASQLGIHASTLYRLVNGERAVSIRMCKRISGFTGIPLAAIAEAIPAAVPER